MMSELIEGGHVVYGQAIGVLMLDTKFPRPVGDIGNANTFSFPVRYKVVHGAFQERVRIHDMLLLNLFIKAAQDLEKEGVKAITTSCGFLVMFQDEISKAVDIPVFTSSLLQVPLVHKMYNRRGRIGIITANSKTLSEIHFKQAELEGIPLAIVGLEDTTEFANTILNVSQDTKVSHLDLARCEQEVVNKAMKLVQDYKDITSIVLECTNLPPYRQAIQRATKKPVFDIVTLVNYIYSAVNGFTN